MAKEKFLTLGGLQSYNTKAEAREDAKDAEILKQAKEHAEGLADNYDAAGTAVTEAGKVQAELDKEVDRATKAENTLTAKLGEVPADKTVAQMIADAQAAATYDDTQVKADIKSNTDAIALLNDGASVAGSVDYKIAQAVASIMENPDETMNSINELVTWCNDHAADALEISNRVTVNANDIDALEALVGTTGVAQQITDAIEGALKIEGVDKYALATDLTNAIARIVALETDSHTHANKTVLDGVTAEKVAAWDASEQNAKTYADGLNTAMDGRVAPLEADMTQAKKDIDAVEAAVATKVEQEAYNTKVAALEGEDTAMKGRLTALETAIGEGGSVDTQIGNAIADLDANVASTNVEEGKGVKVSVVETDGKLVSVTVEGNYDNAYDTKGAAAKALEDAMAHANGKDEAIAEAKQAGTDASAAVTALSEGQVTTNANAITALEEKVGEGYEVITETEIEAMFA